MHLTEVQWIVGALAAALVGLSKTGVPGVGILVVPLMAQIFGGRLSVGALLPMLVFGDLFAVIWYRRHGKWDRVWELVPTVLIGLAIGALTLHELGERQTKRDWLDPIIGVIVLAILILSLIAIRRKDSVAPRSRIGIYMTGLAGGFTTMVSNAAGPIMTIYFNAQGLAKNEFMGTSAWYYFTFNLIKLPILFALTLDNPGRPLMTASTGWFDLAMAPCIAIGAFAGRWVLARFSQGAFTTVILFLAAAAAIKLVLS